MREMLNPRPTQVHPGNLAGVAAEAIGILPRSLCEFCQCWMTFTAGWYIEDVLTHSSRL